MATSFHSTSEDFQSMLVVPLKYYLQMRVILWKLVCETNLGTFLAYHLMEDHQGSFHNNRLPTDTYVSPHRFFSPQLAASLYTPHCFAFGNFHSVFLTAFHSGFPFDDPQIHRSVVSVSLFNISFTLGYQFRFVIATCDATWMVHEKRHQKWFSGGLSLDFLKGVEGSKVA